MFCLPFIPATVCCVCEVWSVVLAHGHVRSARDDDDSLFQLPVGRRSGYVTRAKLLRPGPPSLTPPATATESWIQSIVAEASTLGIPRYAFLS